MFVIGERKEPTEQSRRVVRKFAEQLIPCFKDVDHILLYYDVHEERISFDLDYANKYLSPDDRILEVGAFPFFLTLPMMSKNYDVTTLDKCSSFEFDPAIVDKFKIKVIDCDLDVNKIPANDFSFDCVIMNEVFEHLRINLIFSMREVCRVYLEKLGVMGHVREYTAKEVKDFLQQVGFEIEGVIYRGSYSGSWFWKLSHQFTRVRPEFKPYFLILARKK